MSKLVLVAAMVFATMLFPATVFTQVSSPDISSVPTGTADGAIAGTNFGSVPGTLWLRPVVKLSAKTRAQGIDEGNYDHVYSTLGNRIVVPVTWSSTSLTPTLTASDRMNIVATLIFRAQERLGITLAPADIEFRWQVENAEGKRSRWK